MEYLDLNLKLPIHPLSGDMPPARNDMAIRGAIKHLCLYGAFENPYEYGTEGAGLYEYIFSLSGARSTRSMIYTKLANLIKTHEPRVRLNDIDVDLNEAENGLNITIAYTIIATSLDDSIEFLVIRTS